MIIATNGERPNLKEFAGVNIQVIYLESVPKEWTDFITIFELFLKSCDSTLLIHTCRNKPIDESVFRLNTIEYFDCFDISSQHLSLVRYSIKWIYAIKIMMFNLLFGLRFFLIEGFLSTRIAKTAIRAKAIQRISEFVGAPGGVRVNYLSKNPKALIFSRRAASYLIDFNSENIIDVDSVLRSVLRSSNLSFGALQ
jgi:hypothetical protein